MFNCLLTHQHLEVGCNDSCVLECDVMWAEQCTSVCLLSELQLCRWGQSRWLSYTLRLSNLPHTCSFISVSGGGLVYFCMCLASWQPVFLISLHPTFWLSLDCSFFGIVNVHSVCFLFCAFLMYVIFRNTASVFNESCLCIPQNCQWACTILHSVTFPCDSFQSLPWKILNLSYQNRVLYSIV